MRFSSYSTGAPLNGQPWYILLHGYTGAVDKVPPTVGRLVLERRGEEADEHVRSWPKDVVEALSRRGYLTELDAEQERRLLVRVATTLHENDLATSPTGFIFVPTYACNLRCPYCFQPHEMHAGKGRFGRLLTEEGVDRGFDVIDEYGRPGALGQAAGLVPEASSPVVAARGGDVGLFGGEPLQAACVGIVRHIVERAAERGRGVSAITNGVELDAFRDLLRPGALDDVQITLDGTGSTHDRRRVGPGFTATFDRISDNIDMALQRGVRVKLRMNVDATNAAQIGPLDEHCASRGWAAHPGFTASAAVVSPEGAHGALLTQADLVDRTLALKRERPGATIEAYERDAYETLNKCLESDGYPFRRVSTCAAETGLLIFDPVGDVYTCWEEIGEPARRIGTYGHGGLRLDVAQATRWLTRFPGAIDDCSRCPYALIHTSGCAKHAENLSGTIHAAACETFQQYFPTALAQAWAEYEERILGPAAPAPT